MKHLAAFALLISVDIASAQCVYTNLGFSGQTNIRWCAGHVLPDGSMLVAAVPTAQPVYGGVLTMRLDPSGNMLQSDYLHTTDPYVRLYPTKILPTASGGIFMMGHRVHPFSGENFFALEFDAAGDVVWAKILMEPVSSWGDDMSWNLDVAPLPGGGYAALYPCGDGLTRVTLDQSGTPIGHKRYRFPTMDNYAYYTATAHMVDTDGSALYAGHYVNGDTLDNDTTILVHTDVNGDPDWSTVVDTGAFIPSALIGTSDGGYVIAGGVGEPWWNGVTAHAAMLKVDAAGVPQWKKEYGGIGRFSDVKELPSGELIATLGRRWGYVTTGADTVALMRTTSAGDVTEAFAWSAGQPSNDWFYWAGVYGLVDGGTDIVGLRGDSILVGATVLGTDSGAWYPGLMIAQDAASIGCGMAPVPVTTTTLPVFSGTAFTAEVQSSSPRVWDMAVSAPLSANELDLTAYLAAWPARPGFNTGYTIYGQNLGGLASAPVTTTFMHDPSLTFVSAWPAPTSVTGNVITWTDTTTLQQFEGLSRNVTLYVPVGTPLGTQLVSSVVFDQADTEVTLANNTSTLQQTVVGSYDPNDKQVWPRDLYHIENDSVLDYTIQFQNTGTDTAFNIVVIDTLPLDVDVTTIRFGAASHPYSYELSGNGILTFTFSHILLPDSNTNEPLSHGLVNFRIKPILPLTLGQTITNAADIYFDFNPPIRTPDATVVVTDETGVHPAAKPEKLTVYPVPVRTTLTAALPPGFKPVSAFAIGSDGRRVPLLQAVVLEKKAEYNVQQLSPGAYVVALTDRTGRRMSARFTKE